MVSVLSPYCATPSPARRSPRRARRPACRRSCAGCHSAGRSRALRAMGGSYRHPRSSCLPQSPYPTAPPYAAAIGASSDVSLRRGVYYARWTIVPGARCGEEERWPTHAAPTHAARNARPAPRSCVVSYEASPRSRSSRRRSPAIGWCAATRQIVGTIVGAGGIIPARYLVSARS